MALIALRRFFYTCFRNCQRNYPLLFEICIQICMESDDVSASHDFIRLLSLDSDRLHRINA